MSEYKLKSSSDVIIESNAKTLSGAKREATKWGVRGQTVYVCDKEGYEIHRKEYGKKWRKCE